MHMPHYMHMRMVVVGGVRGGLEPFWLIYFEIRTTMSCRMDMGDVAEMWPLVLKHKGS